MVEANSGAGRTRLLAALGLATLIGAAPPTAVAQGGQAIGGFHAIGDYVLEVDGEAVPTARIYSAQAPPAILIVTSRFPAPVVLFPRTGSVETVQTMKMAERADGSIDLLAGSTLEGYPSFQVDGLEVAFTVGSVSARIKPKPPLLGLHHADDLREYSPDYVRREAAYQPSGPILERLRGQGKSVRVRVFFGSWCPACAQMVPRILKVEAGLDGSRIDIEFYGLPRGFGGEPEATRYGISSVPTAIVFVDDREVGRIAGNGWRVPELTLNNLLLGG